MLNGNQAELARKEANLIAVVEENASRSSPERADYMTLRLSSCTKMPWPSTIKKRNITSSGWR